MVSPTAQGAAAGASFGPGGAIVGGLFGFAGGVIQSRESRKFRRRQRRAIQQAREFADQTVSNIVNSELFSSARDFITSTFRDAATSPLAEDFAKRIRQQQSIRGTFTGNLAAAQEAIGVSGFAQNLRRSLLSPALEFATAPERIRQSVLAQDVQLRVAAATGQSLPGLGPQGSIGSQLGGAFGGALSGAAGGFQIGRAFDQSNQFESQLQALRDVQANREGFSNDVRLTGVTPDNASIEARIRELSGIA